MQAHISATTLITVPCRKQSKWATILTVSSCISPASMQSQKINNALLYFASLNRLGNHCSEKLTIILFAHSPFFSSSGSLNELFRCDSRNFFSLSSRYLSIIASITSFFGTYWKNIRSSPSNSMRFTPGARTFSSAFGFGAAATCLGCCCCYWPTGF